MEEAINIPKNLLIGLVLGVVVLGFLLILFGGLEGLKDAWCNLNPTFCGENITYLATDDITAKNSVLALRCAINSVANNEINDKTCPDSKPEYGVRFKLEGDYPEMEGTRRCYENSCTVCRLPETRPANIPEILQISLGGVYNSSNGVNWTNIGLWAELGDIKILLEHKESLFAASNNGVFRFDRDKWKSVFSFTERGFPENTAVQSLIEHNGSVYLAFKFSDNNGLYKSGNNGDTWNVLETKTKSYNIINVNGVFSVGDDLFLLSEGQPKYAGGRPDYEVDRYDSGLYKSRDNGGVWEHVEPRILTTEEIREDVKKVLQARQGTGVSGDYIDIGDKIGGGIGDVKKIIKVGQDLFASSRIATEYYVDSTDVSPFINVRVAVKSGGIFKSTNGGDNWTKLYDGDVQTIIEVDGVIYIFDTKRGVIAYTGNGWGSVVLNSDETGPFMYKFLESDRNVFAATSKGIFKSSGGLWTRLTNSSAIGYVRDMEKFDGALVAGSSEISKVILNSTLSIVAPETSVVGIIGGWINDKYKHIMGTDVPSPFIQTQPKLDYCKVENFNLPQKVEEYRDPILGIDWNPESWIFGYGDPKYLTYWQSFPAGEDDSWRSFMEWEKNVMFIALTSCFPLGKTLTAGKQVGGKVLREAGKKVGIGQVGKETISHSVGDAAGVVINAEGQVFGRTATAGVALPASQIENVFIYSAESGALREAKRGAVEGALQTGIGKEILEKAGTQATKTGFKSLNRAAKVLGFGTPIAFMAALMESILTKYESFGNSLVFKYHSKEPFREPEPLPLDIQPQKTTLFVDGSKEGNYKQSLRPVILDKGRDSSAVGRAQNWLDGKIPMILDILTFKSLTNEKPVDTVPFYLAAPCHTDLQVGDSTTYCKDYIYNPTTNYAYCDLITEGAAKAVNYCGVIVKDDVVQSDINQSCAIPAIRVSSVNSDKYEENKNFCYSKSSLTAEAAYAATIAGSIAAGAYAGPGGACAVGLVGGLITEWLEPNWPGQRTGDGSSTETDQKKIPGVPELGFG